MTVNCLWELEKAVFAELDGDATLSGLIEGVYSHVPQGETYPYVKIDNIQSDDWSTQTSQGIRANITLDVYSQSHGNKQVSDIIAQIKSVLDGVSLTISGCTMVNSRNTFSNMALLSDGLTWKGSLGYSFLIQVN